jgi:hypothetical protein
MNIPRPSKIRLARAMVDVVVLETGEGPIFENPDIRTMVQRLQPKGPA